MMKLIDIIKEEELGYLNLERCQFGEINNVWDFNVVNGQNGEGIYAFIASDNDMSKYYCKNGENRHKFKVPKKYVANLTEISSETTNTAFYSFIFCQVAWSLNIIF